MNKRANYIIIIFIIILLLFLSYILQNHIEIEIGSYESINNGSTIKETTVILLDSIIMVILVLILCCILFVKDKNNIIKLLFLSILLATLFFPIICNKKQGTKWIVDRDSSGFGISYGEQIDIKSYYNIFTMFEIIK